ncbi:MAG: TRAP transporter small permease [Bacteroidota bacterium]
MRKTIDNILEKALIVLMGLMVINVTWQVLSRYLARWGVIAQASTATEELARFLLIWLGLLGAAYASGKGQHLAIDLLPQSLQGKKKDRLSRLINGFVCLFSLLVMMIGGGRLVYLTFALEQSSAALGLPLGVVYMVLPISGLLILYYSLADFLSPLTTQTNP